MTAAGAGLRDHVTGWPLSPVEELDWYLERPGEPNVVQLEAHAPGHLDRAALERALAAALTADPAARRRLAPAAGWHRHLRWEVPPRSADVPLSVTTWSSPGELDAVRESLASVPIPLRERGLRLTLAAGPDRDVLFLRVHHSAFDGVSALAFLAAVGDGYRALVPVAPVAPAACVNDSDDRLAVSRAIAASRAIAVSRAGALPSSRTRSPRRRAGGVAPPGAVTRIAGDRSGPARPGYGYAQWTTPVPRPARDGAVPPPTVNDLLVAALILTVHRWNTARDGARVNGTRVNGTRPGSARISIAVPVNIRDPRHRWAGPGNQSRVIRVSVRPGDCADPPALLAAVSEQVRGARERVQPGLDGASRLLAAGWAPAGLKRVTARLVQRFAAPFVTDTALVSNLGILPVPPAFTGTAGGGRPGPLWFSGPAPMPRGLGLAALTAGGRLCLTIVYSRALFDAAGGASFAAVFRQALSELAPPQPEPVHDPARPAHAPARPARSRPRPEREAT